MSTPSFITLYEQEAAWVWRLLRRLGIPDADVADLVQEVFLVVHRQLPNFEGRAKVQTWLYSICSRVASDFRRKGRVRFERNVAEPPERVVDPVQLDAVATRQARMLLDELLDTLDDSLRPVFVLFELEEMPMQRVAEITGVPVQTAYSRLYAARKRIMEKIAQTVNSRGAA